MSGLLYVLPPYNGRTVFHLVRQVGTAFGSLCGSVANPHHLIGDLIDESDLNWDEIPGRDRCPDCDKAWRQQWAGGAP